MSLCKFLLLEIVSSPKPQVPPPSDNSDPPRAASAEDDEAGELLRQLAIAFFDAAGEAASLRDNPAARQALSYVLPAFAHGRAEHAATVARVAPAVLHAVVARRAEEAELALDSDDDDNAVAAGAADGSKVKLTTVGEMLVDWTDPRKVVVPDDAGADRWDEAGRKEGRTIDGHAHLVLAEAALERVLAHGCAKDERKALLSMLGKLYVSPHSSLEASQRVLEVAQEAAEAKTAPDAVSRNALNKLITNLEKATTTLEGKDKPARGRKSTVAPGAPREAGAEMTVIEEETAIEADDVKTEIDEDASGGDRNDEDQEMTEA